MRVPLRILSFRGVGSPVEFVLVTMALVVFFPIFIFGMWSITADQNPAVVKALGETVVVVVLVVAYPWVWLAALCRLIRWLVAYARSRSDR